MEHLQDIEQGLRRPVQLDANAAEGVQVVQDTVNPVASFCKTKDFTGERNCGEHSSNSSGDHTPTKAMWCEAVVEDAAPTAMPFFGTEASAILGKALRLDLEEDRRGEISFWERCLPERA